MISLFFNFQYGTPRRHQKIKKGAWINYPPLEIKKMPNVCRYKNINCRHIQLTVNLQSFDYMPQSENNANDVPFLQEDKNSIMGKQWTFYPPNRGIGTL